MKAKKIISGIAKISALSGIAYFAYKFGEFNAKEREHCKNIEEYCDFQDNIYTEGEAYVSDSRGDNS